MWKRIVPGTLALTLLVGAAPYPRPRTRRAAVAWRGARYSPAIQSQYFQETQHAAMNSFASFWRRTPNALFVLGYPISQPFIEESFTNPGEYYRVQYFERAVLEEHPENAGSQYYILGRLPGQPDRREPRGRGAVPTVATPAMAPSTPRPAIRCAIARRRSAASGRRTVALQYSGVRSPSSSRKSTRPTARPTGCNTSSASAWSGTPTSRRRSIEFCWACWVTKRATLITPTTRPSRRSGRMRCRPHRRALAQPNRI